MFRPLRRNAAFTLMEMLVALGLMALLGTALYGSLRVGFRARKSAERAIQPVRALVLALELLRRDLESVPPPTGILAGALIGTDETAATGRDADMLTLYSHAEGAGGDGAPVRMVALALAESEDGTDTLLVRRVTDNLLAPTAPEPDEETLCRGVASLNLRYFDGAVWSDSWDSGLVDNALPVAVEVGLELRAPDSEDGAAGPAGTRVFLLPCGGAPPDAGGRSATVSR